MLNSIPYLLVIVTSLVFFGGGYSFIAEQALAQSIANQPSPSKNVSSAKTEENKLLAFKSIYIEPVRDNLDGAFRETFASAYKEVFTKNPRFEMVASPEASDTILRTVVEKKTTGIDIELSLVLTQTGEIFSSDRTTLDSMLTPSQSNTKIKELLKTELRRIPFFGTLTGRDGKQLTLDIGALHGLKQNDKIQISRIETIQRHPLLKSIVDVQLVTVGTAVVDEVEDTFSFGHVDQEIAGEKIHKYYKVTAIHERPPKEPPLSKKEEELKTFYNPDGTRVEVQDSPDSEEGDHNAEHSTMGLLGVSGFLGHFASKTSQSNATSEAEGSGFTGGGQLLGELWLTKNFYLDLNLGFYNVSYGQSVSGRATPDSNTSITVLGSHAGYRYLINGSINGPLIYLELGYYNFNWSAKSSAADLMGSKNYRGLDVGLGGTLPLNSQVYGLNLGTHFLLFPSVSESGAQLNSSALRTAVSGVGFLIGGYYKINNKIEVRAAFAFESYSAEFREIDQASLNATSSTNQRQYGFQPSFIYYF